MTANLSPLGQDRGWVDQPLIRVASRGIASSAYLRRDSQLDNSATACQILPTHSHHRRLLVDHAARVETALDVDTLEGEFVGGENHLDGELVGIVHESVHIIPVVGRLLMHHWLDQLPQIVPIVAAMLLEPFREALGVHESVDMIGNVLHVHSLDNNRCAYERIVSMWQ